MVTGGNEQAVLPSTFVSPPAGLSGPVVTAAQRALQRLPAELLRAMVRGLRKNSDDLVPGVLFRRKSSGGCAVGITLRELAPDSFDFGWFQFWLRQRWHRGIERDVAHRFPHLNHLQRHFDDSVKELRRAGGDAHPAKTVGLWFAASAQAELVARGAAVEVAAPARRVRSRRRQLGRISGHETDTRQRPAGPGGARWQ